MRAVFRATYFRVVAATTTAAATAAAAVEGRVEGVGRVHRLINEGSSTPSRPPPRPDSTLTHVHGTRYRVPPVLTAAAVADNDAVAATAATTAAAVATAEIPLPMVCTGA